VYCQNYQISQYADEIATRTLSPDELADETLALQRKGAHNINLVSPTHVIAQVAEGLCIAREQGLSIPIVYNTNGYDAAETLRCLEGLIDIYLPDIKYSDDTTAQSYSGIPHYVEVNRRAIAEMFRQVGNLVCDRRGIARRGLLVRHLVMPGGVEAARAVIDFLADDVSPRTYVNVMGQYHPAFRAREVAAIDRRPTAEEHRTARSYALERGLRLAE